MEIGTNYHNKNFALRLALKERLRRTRKWPVGWRCGRKNFNSGITLGGGGGLAYMGHIGMCRCEGYGFQAVYSSIGYINQSVWV